MHYKTFDTHKYIKNLQETGFNEQQAEVIVKSLLESRDFDLSILATREQVNNLEKKLKDFATKDQLNKLESNLKAEINGLRKDTKTEINGLRQETKAEIDGLRKDMHTQIASIKYDILKWVIPMMLSSFAMTVAIIVKLF